ncbi:MAG TPA: dihydrofolate reductase family protein [Acidimicrobiales bacterium]|nr:dihydrofolate reductase family protein [Acidimicrobiales bacterium]
MMVMARMLWHNTMSLDGYVAGPNDNMGWMQAYVGPNKTVMEVLPQIGAILMGARTYRGVMANPDQATPYGGAIDVPYLVLTHADPSTAQTGFQFVRGDMKAVVESAKAAAGERYVAVLGQQAGRAVLQAGLLDEILIHLVPALLGDGVRMFESGQETHDLAIKLCRQSTKVIDLWFTCQAQGVA